MPLMEKCYTDLFMCKRCISPYAQVGRYNIEVGITGSTSVMAISHVLMKLSQSCCTRFLSKGGSLHLRE